MDCSTVELPTSVRKCEGGLISCCDLSPQSPLGAGHTEDWFPGNTAPVTMPRKCHLLVLKGNTLPFKMLRKPQALPEGRPVWGLPHSALCWWKRCPCRLFLLSLLPAWSLPVTLPPPKSHSLRWVRVPQTQNILCKINLQHHKPKCLKVSLHL